MFEEDEVFARWAERRKRHLLVAEVARLRAGITFLPNSGQFGYVKISQHLNNHSVPVTNRCPSSRSPTTISVYR